MLTRKTFFTLGIASLTLAAPVLGLAQGSLPIYVGTYTGAKSASKGIYRTFLNLKDGTLSKPELVAETGSPSFIAFHPNGKYLYAVNEDAEFNSEKSGAVSSFLIDAQSGKLTSLNQVSSRGYGPAILCWISRRHTPISQTMAAATSRCFRFFRTAIWVR